MSQNSLKMGYLGLKILMTSCLCFKGYFKFVIKNKNMNYGMENSRYQMMKLNEATKTNDYFLIYLENYNKFGQVRYNKFDS